MFQYMFGVINTRSIAGFLRAIIIAKLFCIWAHFLEAIIFLVSKCYRTYHNVSQRPLI